MSSSGGASSIYSNRQQSRLAQPPSGTTSLNRLSFGVTAGAAAASSSIRSSSSAAETPTTPPAKASTFQPHISKMQYVVNDASRHHQQQYPANALPNANTSGLPAPSTRHQRGQSTVESTGTTPIPSTISSALRRRQAAATSPQIVPPPNRASSRLPSPSIPGTYSPQYHGGSGSYRQSSSFTVHLRQTTPVAGSAATSMSRYRTNTRRGSLDDNDNDEDEEDHDMNNLPVESLPPLRSTSYISRLMTPNRDSPKTKTIEDTTRGETRSVAKPSQLVKPLVARKSTSGPGRSSSRTAAAATTTTTTRGQDSSSDTTSHQSSSTDSSSMSSSCSSAATTTSDQHKNQTYSCSAATSRLPCPQASADARRLSLQHSGYGSLNLKLREPATRASNTPTVQASENEASDGEDDEEEEDEEDDDDDDEDEGQEEDSTTATTLTDSTNIMSASVGHEFNNMIQMLSSRAILGGTDKAASAISREQSNLSQLPRVKKDSSKVVKSQSHMSFNAGDNQQQSRQQPLMSRQQTGEPNYVISGQKLARPKSRIIFDPTSSQFHVSCSIEDNCNDSNNNEDGELSSSGEDNSSDEIGLSSMGLLEPMDSFTGSTADTNDQDEVSKSLLNTQSQILSLTQQISPNRDPMRRLSERRGSLESLVRIAAPPSKALPDIPRRPELTTAANYGLLSSSMDRNRRTKSPVGSALRNLFGFGANQQQQQSTGDSESIARSAPARETTEYPVVPTRTKTATIVRHSSLRSDPRLYNNRLLNTKSVEREYSKSPDMQVQPHRETATSECGKSSANISSHNLGSEFLLKAGKKLSASSSSLTSRFRFMTKPASPDTSKLSTGKAQQTLSEITTSGDSNYSSNEIRRSLSIASNGTLRQSSISTNNVSNRFHLDSDRLIFMSIARSEKTRVTYIHVCLLANQSRLKARPFRPPVSLGELLL